ncbi:HPP family protein [Desulfoscipio gibsoniae]|uniref:CBS-domain-containing membrane protein n=1 Tax=Desulfoscipio gibsoniae DSM 7213 TaxID=767817 RepID=R4KEI8_9FIRM|nr:HPP family protein [Desulfoscipio gibsoniae]AGL01603.1 CBS-domain-containing membrane protein [Desulfoscipio gibsoniae DSM 7213]
MKNSLERAMQDTYPSKWKTLTAYLCKMKGGHCTSIPKISLSSILITAMGSFAGLGLVAALADHYGLPLLLPSFGASAALLYAACHLPMAQPRNVLGGHVISAFIGVLVYRLFGYAWWVIPLGVTLAIIVMTLTYTLHPPGGATAFLAIYTHQDFSFILSPVGLGIICLLVIALLVNNISSERKYPDYWY